jgi:hypothetical protein
MGAGKLFGIAGVWAVSLVGVGLWANGSVPGPQATAQPTGSITGRVEDVQGGAIPGTTIVLISESRGTRSTPATSGAAGNYVFLNVTPDVYTVEATMPGFRTLRRAGIAVTAGNLVTVPTLLMQTGITVSAQQPRTVGPGDTMGPVIAGDDIGFQPVYSPNTPAGAVAGRWMVRVNGEWRVATGVMQTVPVR